MAETGIAYRLTTPRGVITFNDYALADYYRLTSIESNDFGMMRSHVEDVPQRDFGIVSDAFEGPAYPVVQGVVVTANLTTRRTMLDTLMACLHSIKRADGTLDWLPTGAATRRRRTVRLLERPQVRTSGVLKEFQFALVAPDPLAVSEVLTSVDSSALGVSGSLGPGPLWWFFTSTSGGNASVTPGGTVPAWPHVYIYGPATSPIVTNNLTGAAVSFPGLTIGAGSLLDVNMRAETAYMNGVPSADWTYLLDASLSQFWSLEPLVENPIKLEASGATAATHISVLYRDSWPG